MKKNLLLSFVLITLSFGTNIILSNSLSINPRDIVKLISNNIDSFNIPKKGCNKPITNFKKVSNNFSVYSVHKEFIGNLIIFDDNDGYIFINNKREIVDSNFNCGLSNYSTSISYLLYDGQNYYNEENELIHTKFKKIRGTGISDKFQWHANSEFTTQKTRTLLSELDYPYSTKVYTSSTVYNDKVIWSTIQNENDCGPIAIANLLWTYKVNNIVDLTGESESSEELASILRYYVAYSDTGTLYNEMLNARYYFITTGYTLDYTNIVNGISDTLENEGAPLIGLYNSDGEGHYALISGKGRSVYQTIFGVNLYTSWDIVNTWYTYGSTTGGYLRQKYWVDNQYLSWGYVLRDSNGNTVSLSNS